MAESKTNPGDRALITALLNAPADAPPQPVIHDAEGRRYVLPRCTDGCRYFGAAGDGGVKAPRCRLTGRLVDTGGDLCAPELVRQAIVAIKAARAEATTDPPPPSSPASSSTTPTPTDAPEPEPAPAAEDG